MRLHASGLGRSLIGLVALALLPSIQPLDAQEQWRWEGVERQVVIPDVHGAYENFVELLKATGVVDENLDWAGGETYLVSLGDLLDRGAGSRAALDLLIRLEGQAEEAGGKVHVVMGNHELMVMTGDLRYVSEPEFAAFADEEPEGVREMAFEWFVSQAEDDYSNDEAARAAFAMAFPQGYFGFREAFSADGQYGPWLLERPAIIAINGTAYVHGGLPELVAEMSLDDLNAAVLRDREAFVRGWEALVENGQLPRFSAQRAKDQAVDALYTADPSRCIEDPVSVCRELDVPDRPVSPLDPGLVATLERFVQVTEAPVLSSDGPMWYRGTVYCKPILEEPVLEAGLATLHVDRVVVGHTPTFDRRVHSLYDGRVLMTDTGMLVPYYSGRPAALIVEGGETTVQYLQPEERTVPLTGGQVLAGGLNRADVLTALSEGEVTVFQQSGGGPVRTLVRHGGAEIEALFYEGDAGELEQAAYLLDDLMGLDMVPPTVIRSVAGDEGALQLRFPDVISESQRTAAQLGIGGWCPVDPQFDLMSMFDYLTFNPGRSAANLLYRRNLWSMHITDHGRAFGTQERLPNGVSELLLAPGTTAALESLDRDTLEDVMDGLLSGRQIRALLARRDVILREARSR